MKRFFLFTLCLLVSTFIGAQEMEFQVTINTPKLQTADPKIFEELESALTEYLNNTKWTEDIYEVEERVKCNIQLNIRDENSPTEFTADLQIQAVRPIYGSSEETVILSHADKDLLFTYQLFQPIQYTQNNFNDNLSQVMAFYVYYILGLDYDTYAPFGGEKYFQTAQEIMISIPASDAARYKGWRSLDGNRNRYWMIESMLNPRMRGFRQSMYDYHRLGLDLFTEDVELGKAGITSAIEAVGKAEKNYPKAMVLQMFTNAKSGEIVEIFKKALSKQKTIVRSVMSRLDAANAAKYRAIGR